MPRNHSSRWKLLFSSTPCQESASADRKGQRMLTTDHRPKRVSKFLALLILLMAVGIITGMLAWPVQPTMAGFTPTFTPVPPTPTPVPPTPTPVPPTPTPPPPPPPTPTPAPPIETPTITPTPRPTFTPTATRTPTPTATPEPKIVVEKQVVPGTVNPGDRVQMTIIICNRGTAAANNVVMEDTLPEFLAILSVRTTAGIPSVRGQTVTVRIGTLEPGKCVTITIDAQVRANTPPGTAITNIAVVRYDGKISEGRFPAPTPTPVPLLPETGQPVSENMALGWFILLGLFALATGLYLRNRR